MLHVARLKGGLSTTQPLRGDELRATAAWLKERTRMKVPDTAKTFFLSEQRKPLHRSTVNLLLEKYANASLSVIAYPHMLRHSVTATSSTPSGIRPAIQHDSRGSGNDHLLFRCHTLSQSGSIFRAEVQKHATERHKLNGESATCALVLRCVRW